MAQSSTPLTSLTEAQRAQAQKRFSIIRPALEDGITQAQVARTHNIPAPTVRRWMKRYRDKSLAGLADAATRSDKGKSRRLPPDAIALIEGLALQNHSGLWLLFIVRWSQLQRNKDGSRLATTASAKSLSTSIPPF